MVTNPAISALLELQIADTRLLELKNQLKSLPEQENTLRAKASRQKEALESEEKAYQALELRRREIDKNLSALEENRIRFKTQQLSVKKNEEYEALNHQIATTASAIESLENEGLELLSALDRAKEALDIARQSTKIAIEEVETRLTELSQVSISLGEKIREQEVLCQTLSAKAAPAALSSYERVKRRPNLRPPFIVQMKDHRCQGCYLKLSQEVETAVLKGEEGVVCDQCGRLLILPS